MHVASCKQCLDVHGAGCAATHTTEEGEPICVFCLDGVPCPVQQKQQRLTRGKGAIVMEPGTENSTQTQAPTSPRVCEHPDCDRELGPLNRSGRCGKHFHWKRTAKARPSPGAKHVTAGLNGANGHAPEPEIVSPSTPESGPRSVDVVSAIPKTIREDRVDRLLLSLPLADKSRIAAAWLAGEL